MGQVEDLETRLRGGEKTLFDKFSARLTHVESLRPVFGFVALAGAMIAAIARAVSGQWGLGFTIFGAVVAAAGGTLVVLMDYKKLEISQDAKEAHRIADDAIAALRVKEAELASSQRLSGSLDRKRLARIEATRLMIECVEAALLTDADTSSTAQVLLKTAIASLRSAVDYRAGDFLTFTIFKKVEADTQEVMQYIARAWTDEREAQTAGRSWKPGEGYTGHLWSLARDNRQASVVEPDTQTAEARGRYRVEGGDQKREGNYRSVASFPILVGEANEIWGVVTATSDRPGVFDHNGDLPRQSVEAVRDIALIASLLAKVGAK